MAKPATPRPSRPSQTTAPSSMEQVSDDGLLSGNDSSSDPRSCHESTPSSADSGTELSRSSDSVSSLNRRTGLAASIRVLSDSLLRVEMAEMEMVKAREAARWEAEKRRLEMEAELTRMVLQTHLQAVSLGVRRKTPKRKRKRSSVQEHSTSTRDMGLLVFSLLQLNLIFWNSQA